MPPSTVVVNGKAFVFVFVLFGREEYLNLMHGGGGLWGRRHREKLWAYVKTLGVGWGELSTPIFTQIWVKEWVRAGDARGVLLKF